MPRKFFKRLTPDREKLRNLPGVRHLDHLLHDPNLFHFNRRSVAIACAVGMFIALLPIPFQLFIGIVAAFTLRCNLPIVVALVFVSNPLTIPFIFIATYYLGCWMLGMTPGNFGVEASWTWLTTTFIHIWQPVVLGCLALGVIAGGISYFLVHWFWRWHVLDRWNKRRALRKRQQTNREHKPQ